MDEKEIEVNHGSLLGKGEPFKAEIDIDGLSHSVGFPAFNGRSAEILLQILMIANHPRIGGYVVRKSGGDLIAAVAAESFIQQMTQATSLKGKAPEKVEEHTLTGWNYVKVGKPMEGTNAKTFVLEAVIDGAVDKQPVSAPSLESMVAVLTAATCAKLPRISGWNLYDVNGELLVSVPVVAFIAELAQKTPLGKAPANAKAAGWRALPLVAPTSDGFQKLMDEARKDGRIPT